MAKHFIQDYFKNLLNKRHKCLDPSGFHYFGGSWNHERETGTLPKDKNEALAAIRTHLLHMGYDLDLAVHRLNDCDRVLDDEELLRLLVEQGADLSQLDQRMFWSPQRRHLAEYLTRGLCVNYRDPAEHFPGNGGQWEGNVDEHVIRLILETFGEIPRQWEFGRRDLTLTTTNSHMFDILTALAKRDLASTSFFAAFEKQLIIFRGAENYFISLLGCGKWKKTKREIVVLAARHGHLNLLRRMLDGRDDDVFLAQKKEQTTTQIAATDDYVNMALLHTDRLDVLQLLVNEYNADINTFGDGGNTVLHSLCRSAAAHAKESLRWLFTSSDFALMDCEHSEDGTALDVVCAYCHFSLLEELLHFGYGYSLPLRKSEVDRCGVQGIPLIGYVCGRKCIPVSSALLCVEELMRRGARLDARDKVRGDTPIIIAARHKNWELTTALLDRDRRLVVQENKFGESCATFVAEESEKDIDANMLLKKIIFIRLEVEKH